MKVTFVGGGGLRNLPLLRELLRHRELMAGGEIALYDLAVERAQLMAEMARKTPEYADPSVTLSAPARLEEALEGASFVYFAIRPWSHRQLNETSEACQELGFLGSDNVSLSGSFMATRGIPAALRVACAMERLCPEAWLLIFTNPIAVLTGAVHQATGIQAVGVCGGCTNHAYDLPHLMGWPSPDFGFEVEAAGVNHMSWMTSCRYHGEEFFPMLDRHLEQKGLDFGALRALPHYEILVWVLERMVEMHRLFGGMPLASEFDGFIHPCYYPEGVEYLRRRAAAPGYDEMRRQESRTWEEFAACARRDLPAPFWQTADRGWKITLNPDEAVGIQLIRALSGSQPVRAIASYPNRGAVAGLPDVMVTEHSLIARDGRLEKAGTYDLPAGVGPTIRATAEHQHLTARAIVMEDRRAFVQAMLAYPPLHSLRQAEQLLARMVAVSGEDAPGFLTG